MPTAHHCNRESRGYFALIVCMSSEMGCEVPSLVPSGERQVPPQKVEVGCCTKRNRQDSVAILDHLAVSTMIQIRSFLLMARLFEARFWPNRGFVSAGRPSLLCLRSTAFPGLSVVSIWLAGDPLGLTHTQFPRCFGSLNKGHHYSTAVAS